MTFLHRLDRFQLYDYWLNAMLGAGTLGVVAAGYLFIFQPFHSRIHDIHAETDGLRDLIQQATEISQKHQALTVELTESKQAAAKLAERIPAAPRESDFLHQISQLADQTGLEIADYHPGTIDQRENHHEMEVKVNTHGEYPSLCKFMKEIDHLPRLCRLTQMDINTDLKDKKLKVDMLFRIYFAPPTAETPAKKG